MSAVSGGGWTPGRDMRVVGLDGMFVDLLSPEERELFDAAVRKGHARRVYENGAGLMGLARVGLCVVYDGRAGAATTDGENG